MAKLTTAIQEAILALVCFDADDKGARFVRSLVPINVFDIYYRDVAEAAYAYIDRFSKPPGEHTLDLIQDLKLKREKLADVFDRIYQSLLTTNEGVNRDYVLEKTTQFIRVQRIKKAMLTAVEQLELDTDESVLKAEQGLVEALRMTPENFNPGMTFNDPKQALTFLDNEDLDLFPTGIHHLDMARVGPARKTLHVFVALPNKGKSWYLLNLAKHAMLHRRRVLYISLEMDEKKLARRMVQSFFSMTSRQVDSVDIPRIIAGEDEVATDFDFSTIRNPKSLEDPDIRRKLLRRFVNLKHRPRLVIKQFPSGELTTPELDRYIDALESSISFIPDLILVDYADEMTVPPDNYRHGLNQIYRGLRGIAVRRNLAIATASQASKAAEGVKLVTRKHIAEDFRKIAIADNIIIYSQTSAEEQLGFARLFIDKARDEGIRNRLVLLSQAYPIGQFALSSSRMRPKSWFALMKTEAEASGEETNDHDD